MKKGKRKAAKIICVVFAVLIAVVSGAAIWQKDNIKAFILSRKYSSKELLAQMSENDKQLKEEIEKYFPEGIREYTDEEKEQIESGELSEKQVLAKILSEKSEELENKENMTDEEREIYEKIEQIQKKINPNVKVSVDTSDVLVPKPAKDANSSGEIVVIGKPSQSGANNSSKSDHSPTAESIISKYVSQLYALEGKYIGYIEGVVSSAKGEAKSKGLTKKDTSALLSIGAKYTSRINSLEASCDGEVEAVISNLKRELNAIGADTGIISTIRSAYSNEKSLKRAYYMNMIY